LGGLNEKTRIGRVLFAGDVGESDSEITKSVANDSDDEALKLDDASVSSKSEDGAKKKGRAKLLHVLEVREQTRLLFDTNSNLMNLLFGNLICNKFTLKNSPLGFEILKFSPDNFFLEVLPVSPNRFRPENKLSESTYLHPHTTILQKILTINYELKSMLIRAEDPSVQLPQTKNNQKIVFGINNKEIGLKETFAKWIEMQEAVNSLYDSSKTGKLNTDGETCIKQLLEKKEGIFRMKIMGKRVNYAARSVISPDPMLDTNEVGVPMFMAKKLTFPEGVNEANCEKLKQLVKNGPSVWPGALYVSENG
jgi:DNA-directed RNA polymerase I subunit RPA1